MVVFFSKAKQCFAPPAGKKYEVRTNHTRRSLSYWASRSSATNGVLN